MYASRGEQLDRALQLAKAAVAEVPDHPDFNDTLAFVYLKKQLASLAIPPLRLAIEKEPGNPAFHYHLGLALSQTGDQSRGAPVAGAGAQAEAGFRRGGGRAEGAEDARVRCRRPLGSGPTAPTNWGRVPLMKFEWDLTPAMCRTADEPLDAGQVEPGRVFAGTRIHGMAHGEVRKPHARPAHASQPVQQQAPIPDPLETGTWFKRGNAGRDAA